MARWRPQVVLAFAVPVFLVFAALDARAAFAGSRIWLPVRWCGIEGAPSIDNPAAVGEATSDDVLWRRHERPTDAIYIPFTDMSFRAGSTAAIKDGPQSFPIIRDPAGTGGSIDVDSGEATDAVIMCRRAWMMGDPLYLDPNNNAVVDAGVDTLLSVPVAAVGVVDMGHEGAPLHALPVNVRFVDLDNDGVFDLDERIYRDENGNKSVDTGDTLLVQTSGTVIGNVIGGDVGHPLVAVPGAVKYLDLIRQPPNTYSIGYPAVQGVTGVNANDVFAASIAFPVHGIAEPGLGQFGAVMDDASQYLPPGPNFTIFETQLVGHEFGHAFTLPHGDGIDDDGNGVLDDADDPAAPFPGAGPGTLCDNDDTMAYCWHDSGTAGNPSLTWIGVGAPSAGMFTAAQSNQMRNHVLNNMPDRVVDPVTPPLVSARVDPIGDVPLPFAQVDIADFSATTDAARTNSILALQTRRAMPPGNRSLYDFHFQLDLDGNPETGGRGKAAGVPTEFAGVELVASVRVLVHQVQSVTVRRWNAGTHVFEPVPPTGIHAVIEQLEAIPDFPLDLRDGHGGFVHFPAAEVVRVSIPVAELALPKGNAFRVEYLAVDLTDGILDRAADPGMRFELPVFPQCHTAPPVVDRGHHATVFATGMLPDRDVHLLLGADEVGHGHTDKNGSVELDLAIPGNARYGPRLVTVGALAVSADCSVTVGDDTTPGGGGGGEGANGGGSFLARCCKRLAVLLGVLLALMAAALVLLVLLYRSRA
ncbi:MAG TPA: hypothetical protein VGS57_00540 [Thermoanaerobaculia bacterium]|jgi:hypothetical protein|nr:hypothetical protein [Thermoanaerobaculia bacterium]